MFVTQLWFGHWRRTRNWPVPRSPSLNKEVIKTFNPLLITDHIYSCYNLKQRKGVSVVQDRSQELRGHESKIPQHNHTSTLTVLCIITLQTRHMALCWHLGHQCSDKRKHQHVVTPSTIYTSVDTQISPAGWVERLGHVCWHLVNT